MLKNRVFYALMLLTMAVIYICTNTYYTLTLLLLTLVLPVLSAALMIVSGRRISIGMELPQTAEKSKAELTYHVENKSILPAARIIFSVVMENQLTKDLMKKNIYLTAGGKQTSSARLAIAGARAGTVSVVTENIRVYDSLGLFYAKKKRLPEKTVMIYPDMQEMEIYMEKPIETGGDGSRYSPNKTGFDASEIFAMREYVPGDEIRKIHWKLSSKIQKTMVRDFSLPLNYSVFLMVELNADDSELIDRRVELFVSLSRSLLENGINHNLAWYDGGEDEFHVRELDAFEDLEMASAQLLASFSYEKAAAALNYYAASPYRSSRTTLIYITSQPQEEKIAELELLQPVKVLQVNEEQRENQLWI